MNRVARWLEARWYGGARVPWWLTALEQVFITLSAVRRWLYRRGLLRSGHPGVPVIVVGNLVVGGSGKTPLVMSLVRMLRDAGLNPGVVSRGHGRSQRSLHLIDEHSGVEDAGDEPLEIFHATGAPVAVSADRLLAAQTLVRERAIDCIVADDGLQHYRLRRDIEIACVDGRRGLGNRRRLPAGPLREAPSRLDDVDLVLTRNGEGELGWTLAVLGLRALDGSSALQRLEQWRGRAVHALAGLAHPEQFFDTLRDAGLDLREARSFPDHHRYRSSDLQFQEPLPLVITGKDAAKCRSLRRPDIWVLEVQARLPEAAKHIILEKLGTLAVQPTAT